MPLLGVVLTVFLKIFAKISAIFQPVKIGISKFDSKISTEKYEDPGNYR